MDGWAGTAGGIKNDLAKTSPLRIGAYPSIGCHGKSTYRKVKTHRERHKERSQQVTTCEGRGDDGRATERERERRGATARRGGGRGGRGGGARGGGGAGGGGGGGGGRAAPTPRGQPPTAPTPAAKARRDVTGNVTRLTSHG